MRDEDYSEEHLAILRAMSPEQKLKQMVALYQTARGLKAAGLRAMHPDWSEEQVQKELSQIFLHART